MRVQDKIKGQHIAKGRADELPVPHHTGFALPRPETGEEQKPQYGLLAR
jgi:hypothetical protein